MTDVISKIKNNTGTVDAIVAESTYALASRISSIIMNGGAWINLFDASAVTSGKYINVSNGRLDDRADYFTSDFIPVHNITSMLLPYHTHVAWYDESLNFISGVINHNNDMETSLHIAENAHFMRFDMNLAQAKLYGGMKQIMICPNMSEFPHIFIDFGDVYKETDHGQIDVNFRDNTYVGDIKNGYNIIPMLNYATSELIKVTCRKIKISSACKVVAYNANNTPNLNAFLEQQQNQAYIVDAPYWSGIEYVRVSVKVSNPFFDPFSVIIQRALDFTEKKYIAPNFFKGKRILWLGTSIPEGNHRPAYGYPDLVAKRLGCEVINKAIGASGIRSGIISKVTNDDQYGLVGASWNITRNLTQPKSLKQDFVDNWDTWKVKFTDSPASLTQDQKDIILNSSYETILDPYLTNDNVCDVYVIDHGWNDADADLIGKDSDGNKYNTWEFLTTPDSESKSVDPYRYNTKTFRGAFNWIIKHILEKQPQATIVLTTCIENVEHHVSVDAQNNIATENSLHIIPLWRAAGLSPRTINAWKYINAQFELQYGLKIDTVKNVRVYDGTHPQGFMTVKLANFIAAYFVSMIR